MYQRKNNSTAGRTGFYQEDMADRAFRLCLLGLRDADLATAFGVSVKTIEKWKQLKPMFREACRKGRQEADAKVAEALYKRAIGYSHPDTYITTAYDPETKTREIITTPIIKHYPPDTTAALKWLALRQREFWTEVTQVEHTIKGEVTHRLTEALSDNPEISEEELELALKIGLIKAKNQMVLSNN